MSIYDQKTIEILLKDLATLSAITLTQLSLKNFVVVNHIAKKWENAQVPPQSMPEISKTHLYYTKDLLPSLTIFISNILPLFGIRGTSLKKRSSSIGPHDSAT